MRITCIGGGPAGLYLALLMKKRNPAYDISVLERNRPYDTFGWGVVFSDQTLGNLRTADAETYEQITGSFSRWDDIDVHFKGRTITSGGHGFSGIGRKHLLNILQARCEALGVKLVFEKEVRNEEAFDADLIVASDGINSFIRNKYAAAFEPDIEVGKCRFVWLGTRKLFDAFTFAFEETNHGWFQAHAYKFDRDTSTFIVEAPEDVWLKSGLGRMSTEESIAFCENLFAKYLDGHELMSNATHLRGSAQWLKFPRVVCKTWVHHNGRVPVVLMGDAAHTAHFSIGSGTKLALEDAIELADCLQAASGKAKADMLDVLKAYEQTRSVEVLKIQNAARNSTHWFENVKRYTHFEAEQFAYSLLTRSQRISHENCACATKVRGRRRDLDGAEERHQRPGRGAHVYAVPHARPDPVQPRRRIAHGAIFMRRRHAGRLLPRAYRQPRPRRRGPHLHRDDLRLRRRAHLAGLRRPLQGSAQTGVEAHRRLRARPHGNGDRHPVGSCRSQGVDSIGLAGGGRAFARRQLAADRALKRRLRAAQPGTAGDDAGRPRARQGRLRARGGVGQRVRVRLAGASLCSRLSALRLHLAAHQPAHRRIWRLAAQSLPLSAGSVCRDARGVAGGKTHLGAHFCARLGARRQYTRGRRRDRRAVQGCRR
jgi:2-polyprenyl-6-methoxyphenol hydroxylase-like FAD-dependent oxidoreductase